MTSNRISAHFGGYSEKRLAKIGNRVIDQTMERLDRAKVILSPDDYDFLLSQLISELVERHKELGCDDETDDDVVIIRI